MKIILYFNSSEKNKLNKELTNHIELTGNFRESVDIIKPIFLIDGDVPTSNYCYIPLLGRYYFIDSIKVIRTGLVELSCSVDVLMSFKDNIKNLNVILSDSEEEGRNNYLTSDVWVSNVKSKTDILSFQNGLSNDGYFILITAGG